MSYSINGKELSDWEFKDVVAYEAGKSLVSLGTGKGIYDITYTIALQILTWQSERDKKNIKSNSRITDCLNFDKRSYSAWKNDVQEWANAHGISLLCAHSILCELTNWEEHKFMQRLDKELGI